MTKPIRALSIFLAASLLLLASCLKEDPENKTLFYGHQHIPNINYYMPRALLEAFGNEDLHFGDNPPRLTDGDFASYCSDSMYFHKIVLDPDSLWVMQYVDPPVLLNDQRFFFELSDQHVGIVNLNFKLPKVYLEQSGTESTSDIVDSDPQRFFGDTIRPEYFDDPDNADAEVMRRAYLIGNSPDFTLYYYEVRDMEKGYRPLNAAILSGTLSVDTIVAAIDTIQIVNDTVTTDSIVYGKTVKRCIKNVKWGIENITYYTDSENLAEELRDGTQPCPGNILIMKCDVMYPIQYQPTRSKPSRR